MPPRKKTPSKPPQDLDERLTDPLFVPHLDLLELPRALEAAADDYPRVLESICGAVDDSQPVEQYDGTLGVPRSFVDAHQSAVAQVQWNNNLASVFTNPGNVSGVRWGSGTMISPDLFLTAGHLFDQTGGGWNRPRANGTTNIISPQEIAQNMHLNFNFQVDPAGTLRAEQSFAITALVEYRLGGLDMAVCRIAGSPGSTFGFTQVATADAANGDMLCIIGHPAGQPKRIEAGPATAVTASAISYNDIDTLGGNSGSGILHGTSGRVVGVHTNGGCNPSGTGSNFGTPIAAIRAASPTVRNLNTTTNIIADTLGTRLSQDVVATRFGADTVRAADQIGTRLSRDVVNTRLGADTIRAADQLGTVFSSDIATSPRGDVNTLREAGGIDPTWVVDPPWRRVQPGAGLRPFVLANPREAAQVGLEGAADERAQYESVLAQLEDEMARQEAALSELEAEYTEVYSEYEELFGGPG